MDELDRAFDDQTSTCSSAAAFRAARENFCDATDSDLVRSKYSRAFVLLTDEASQGTGTDYVGIHHIGFWVEAV